MSARTPLELALEYAAQGWYVFPCKPSRGLEDDKTPLTKNGFKDATTDPERVRWFWEKKPEAAIGVATGASGLVVVDVDTGKEGADGYDGWAEIKNEDATVEETTLVETPSGGLHAYYRTNGNKVACSTGKLAPSVDVRAEGGYVIAAGSSGYEYVEGHGLDALAELPSVLAEKLAYVRSSAPLIPREALEIPSGQRNDTLFRHASRLRRDGLSPEEALPAIARINREQCHPPLREEELIKIVESVGRYTPADVTAISGCQGADLYTERGNARRFATTEKGKVAYVLGWGWRIYRRGVFADSSSALTQAVHSSVDQVYSEAAACEDEKIQAAIKGWAKRSSSAAGVKNLLCLAEKEPGVEAEAKNFDRDQDLINCKTEIIHMSDRQRIPWSPKFRMTKQAGAEFVPGATCPRWEGHLQVVFQGDEELIAFLQRWAGRALSGLEPTDNCRILLAYGTGANGKTVTVETIAAVLGSYAASTDFQTWCTGSKAGGEVAHPELARLAGTRLVRSTESGHAHQLDESVLKLYTGGEEVTPRLLYQSVPVTYRPQFSLLLSTNHLPRLEGGDRGFWRRFLKVGFDYTIPEPDQDGSIMKTLHAEMPGIFNWMILGYQMWRERGLDPPLSVLLETAEYRSDIDLIAQFVAEELEAEENARTDMKEVYAAYARWAEGMGIGRPLAANTLSQRLKEHGVHRMKDPQTRRSQVLGYKVHQRGFSALGVPL